MDSRRSTLISLLLVALSFAGADGQGNDDKVEFTAEVQRGELHLNCNTKNKKNVTWEPPFPTEGNVQNLGPLSMDPRGTYTCIHSEKADEKDTLQVHVRMCENCIELDAGTISGILVADIIITALIAVAVYSVSGTEKGRLSRASDKQTLIPNEQIYQPLRDRDGSAYSQLAGRARKK